MGPRRDAGSGRGACRPEHLLRVQFRQHLRRVLAATTGKASKLVVIAPLAGEFHELVDRVAVAGVTVSGDRAPRGPIRPVIRSPCDQNAEGAGPV